MTDGKTSHDEITKRLDELLFVENESLVDMKIQPIGKDIIDHQRGKIVYVCTDCRDIVKVTKNPKKKNYGYICSECNSKNIALATKESAKKIYKIKNA
jgi:hypothetical protein